MHAQVQRLERKAPCRHESFCHDGNSQFLSKLTLYLGSAAAVS